MKRKCLCGRCGEIDRDPVVPERCNACGAPTRPAALGIDLWILSVGLTLGGMIVFRAALW